MNGSEVRTGEHRCCREATIVGRFPIRGFEQMDQKLGQESMSVVERWQLWGVLILQLQLLNLNLASYMFEIYPLSYRFVLHMTLIHFTCCRSYCLWLLTKLFNKTS